MNRTQVHQVQGWHGGVELKMSFGSRLPKSPTLRRRRNPSHGRGALVTLAAAILTIATVWGQDKPLPLPDKYEQPLGTCYEELRYPYPTAYLNLFAEGQDMRMSFMDVQPAKDPNGRTVVLLHGKNFYGAYWADTAKFLSDRGFRVIIPDQIGFGKSSKANIHYSFAFLAENTAGLLDLLHVQKATIVGHSMG